MLAKSARKGARSKSKENAKVKYFYRLQWIASRSLFLHGMSSFEDEVARNDEPSLGALGCSINQPTNKLLAKGVSVDTFLAGYDPCPTDPYGSSCMPIYQTATFCQRGATEFGEYDYTRSGNPTRTALENEVSILENGPPGSRCFAFATGMAAISAVVRLVKHGEEIIVSDDSYGGIVSDCFNSSRNKSYLFKFSWYTRFR